MSRAKEAEREQFDACVVGVGAAGGVIASELAKAGMRVVALEAGRSYLQQGAFASDEVAYAVLRNLAWNEPEVVVYNGETPKVTTLFARNIGVGGPLHWSAVSFRFHESDFRVKSASGIPPGSSVEDWPISYSDLEPWYDRYEYDFGVAGADRSNPYDAPRTRGFPMPPVEPTKGALLFERAARELGYNPFPTPAAITTVDDYGGGGKRRRCNHCGYCTMYGCQTNAKASTLVVSLPSAVSSGNLTLLDSCYVYRVLAAGGRANGVEFFDGARKRRKVKAKIVILCNASIYAARLLLISATDEYPAGLANSSGMVGKHLTFHQGSHILALFEESIHADRGPQTVYGIDDLNEDRPKSGHGAEFIRGARVSGGVVNGYSAGPLAFATAAAAYMPLPDGVRRWGQTFKDFITRYHSRHLTVGSLSEDLPVEKNRVEVDDEVKDSWGLPVPRIVYTDHPNNIAMDRFFVEKSEEIARLMGASKTLPMGFPGPLGAAAGHAMGTTRMGSDPAASVVDSYGRCHDLPNLFIGGAGPFVTSAGLNPTETIFALAYRAADHIVSRWKSGGF